MFIKFLAAISQPIDRFYKPWHSRLIGSRRLLDRLFFLSEFLLVLFMIVAWWLILFFPQADILEIYQEIGEKFGILAFGFYGLSLLPGILRRLRLLPLFSSGLLLFRRHFGILMFVFTIIHAQFLFAIPQLGVLGEKLSWLIIPREAKPGVIAFLILIPLWLTSNDFSLNLLKNFWRRLQRLTYLAMFFIVLHLSLLEEKNLFFIGLLMVFIEIYSWIYFWRNKKKRWDI